MRSLLLKLRSIREPSALKQLVERHDLRPEKVAPINLERPEFLLVHPTLHLELRQSATDDERPRLRREQAFARWLAVLVRKDLLRLPLLERGRNRSLRLRNSAGQFLRWLPYARPILVLAHQRRVVLLISTKHVVDSSA